MTARRRWTVYVLVSATRTYVGIALDVRRRLAQHNGTLRGGARSTRAGRPWRVGRRYGPFATRGEALRVEHAVKRLRGRARLRWGPLDSGSRPATQRARSQAATARSSAARVPAWPAR